MKSEDLVARRERLLSPGYYHFFDAPLHLVRGEGMWLWDSAGRRYLDFYNNVPSVGHCHPDVLQALVEQASLLNVSTRYLHESIVEFAEALTAKLPDHLDNCVFACTGTEVNDLAVQIARQVTGHDGVLVAEFCYHGNSTLVLALSTDSYPEQERPPWLATFEVPNLYRGSFTSADPEAGAKYLAAAVEQLDALEARGHRLAAMLVDVSFEAHGVITPPAGFMQALCDEVHRRGALVITDEVQCGYCRMGSHWWGFQHYALRPDIVTCGKPMGDGHPVSALVTAREHAEHFARKCSYFNTFAGNPVSSAVGKAVIDVIDRENLLDSVTETGAYMTARLAELAERHEIVGEAMGFGLFHGLDLVVDAAHKTPISAAELRHLGTLIAEEGVITGTSGRHGNVLKMRPPLPARPEHVDIAVAAVESALQRFSPCRTG